MALANYSDLQSSIANWMHRTDLTSVIPDFVAMAEARIGRDLRLRKQITTSILNCVSGNQAVTLPADWLEFENVSVETSPTRQLVYVPIEHLDAKYPSTYTGMPAVYTIEGDTILFGPAPDSNYQIDTVYYARFPSLITNSTNWLMTNHPNIYLYACLIEACTYTKNWQGCEVYEKRYMVEANRLQDIDDVAMHSGSALRVKVI